VFDQKTFKLAEDLFHPDRMFQGTGSISFYNPKRDPTIMYKKYLRLLKF
jgi:hypothetical protein